MHQERWGRGGRDRARGPLPGGGGRTAAGPRTRLAVAALLGGLPAGAVAQQSTEWITTQLPVPSYVRVKPDSGYYDHHVGPVQIRYTAGTSVTFTDNRNYNVDGYQSSDLGLSATAGVGLFYPLNDISRLQLDFGLGFTYWLERPQDQDLTLNVIPNSHLSYALEVGEVMLTARNTTSSSMEASSRPEYYGGQNTNDRAFSQINNQTGLQAGWGPGRVTTTGNYSFGLTRSLTSDFTDLDRDTHNFGAQAMVEVTPPLQVGVYGSYSLFTYLDNVQNDGQTFSAGPSVQWTPMDSLTVNGRFGYTVSLYDQTGTINDSGNFRGMTFSVSAQHDINKRMRQGLSFSRGVDPGYGSNYTDAFNVGYNFQYDLGPRITPILGVNYNRSEMGGMRNETDDNYSLTMGTAIPVLRRLSLGLNYSHNLRYSDATYGDYTENRVTLSASYQF